MSRKKIAIIIVTVIVVVAAITVSAFIFLKPGSNGNLSTENGNNNNNTYLNQSENQSSGISSSTTTNLSNENKNTNGNANNANANANANANDNANAISANTDKSSRYSSDPNWQSPTYDQNSVTPEYAAEMNRKAEEERQAYRATHPNSGAGSSSAYNNSGDADRIASVDANAYRVNAAQCIKNMLTFDCNSLTTQEYRFSFLEYISVTNETSDIMRTKVDNNYASVMSTYPKFYSQVITVEPTSIYVSHAQHNGKIAVDCKVTIKKNQGYPGEIGWEVINLYEESYLVYFDESGKIFDMQIAQSKVLQGDLFNERPIGTQ